MNQLFRAIRFEIKKIFTKSTLVLLLILLFANTINIAVNYNQTSDEIYERGYSNVYNRVKGTITNDKISFIAKNLEKMTNLVNENKYSSEEVDDDTYTGYVYGDMSVFQDIYNEMYTAALYNESISEKLAIIEENISNAKQGSSKAVYEELKERMINRVILKYYNTAGMEAYLDYDFSTILIILLVITCVVQLYTIDRKSEMLLLIGTTKKYYEQYTRGKLLSVFFIIFFSVIFFRLVDYVIFKQFNYVEGFLNPLYSLPYFNFTYSNITIIGYLLVDIIYKILIIYFFALIIIVLSKFIKKSFILVGISVLLIFGLLNLEYYFYFPVALLQSKIIFQTGKLISFLSIIVNIPIIQIIFIIMMVSIFSLIILKFFERRVRS